LRPSNGGLPTAAASLRPLVFEEVYRAHFDFVLSRAARLGGPDVDAEDAAQETFLIVARKLDTYDHSSQLTTWLYGITLNVVRGLRRKARIRRLWDRREVVDPEPIVESIDRAELRDAHRIAYAILDKMSAKKRDVFILAEFDGLTCEEIALIVGVKTETVWSRLHYARAEFSARLQKMRVP
jgi:RNA polymerase sigma-70 factor (ECF subfamily)